MELSVPNFVWQNEGKYLNMKLGNAFYLLLFFGLLIHLSVLSFELNVYNEVLMFVDDDEDAPC
jgi:hypothetical protein